MSEFVHLHVHTQYSLLDGLNRTEKLFEKVKSSGMDAVAITDHGVMYGVPEFWIKSRDYSVKPIIGCEIYLAPKQRTLRQDIDGIRYYHLLLLAKNLKGYQNLIKIVSISNLEGMYYKPRADIEILKKYSEGLICTSACLAGPLSRHIVRNEPQKAEEWLKVLHSIYKEDFYLEIQRNGIRCEDEIDNELVKNLPEIERAKQLRTLEEQVKVNNAIYDLSKKFKIPIVATTDAHFLNKEDKETQKVLFCIKDGKTLSDPTAMAGYIETYIKTPDELKQDFSDIPEVLTETLKINEKIETFDITYKRVQPHFWNLPKNLTAEEELAKEAFQGAVRYYSQETLPFKQIQKFDIKKAKSYLSEEIIERIDYELKVIHDKGYDDYFLVVSDIMKWSAKNGILTGVRGSVAGSVVAHCLDIVELDPIKWELYFERFLNPERPSPPDIDMDIQDSRRDELIEYVTQKYGKESVAAICAIGRLKTKAAIRDVARVMGIDLYIADKLSKMVTVLFGKPYPFQKMMETSPEFKQIVDSDARLQELGKIVTNIESLSRHMSVHACGYLITPGPVINYTALQPETGGGRTITQWEGPWIEELGLMKFDFLGLRTLSIISDTIQNIKENKNIQIDFYQIPDGDKKTYELFSRGETVGVFQFESPPMQRYLIDLKPETQEDLCFMAAAYRPGPMQYIPDYIKCKHGEKDPEFLIPELKEIVGYTYGFAIYQEQVIRIAVDIAGYTMGGADILRRAMGKKKLDVMQKEEVIFKEGVKKRGYSEEIAAQLWQYLLPFADYGFNKAHAAGYAVLAYKCAYLKAHYPLEFMSALMHADLINPDRIVIDMQEAKRLGFEVLAPDINKSGVYFTPEGDSSIRFGLGAIKNVGVKLCENIVNERLKNGEFLHFDDFIKRVTIKNINKRAVECLIKAGALDTFGDRNALITILPQVFENVSNAEKAESLGQTGLFSFESEHDALSATPKTPFPLTVVSATDKEKLTWEKELLGLFLSSHPLEEFKWTLLKKDICTIAEVQEGVNKQNINLVALISTIKVVHTKKDNSRMAILLIEDFSSSMDAVIFPKTLLKYEPLGLVEEGKALLLKGKVNNRDGKKSFMVESLEIAKSKKMPKKIQIDITKINDKTKLENIKQCLNDSLGIEVEIIYGSKNRPKTIKKFVDYRDYHKLLGLRDYVKA